MLTPNPPIGFFASQLNVKRAVRNRTPIASPKGRRCANKSAKPDASRLKSGNPPTALAPQRTGLSTQAKPPFAG
ncbi:MAG: hypothetical protein HWQ38_31695 [Nostoc sp. NMS7]|uniref:hypothetical protein n=1 Tax=Nostoc sp. NMS7 TaxID=2815391 RepID=UPI0026002667|nr:hypothetical protein [Nostoc sp. NMS7]MBN3950790.1 hypothetical protein [Nostoc sp. NMS7]